MSARDTAENDARCPTPCDDACAVDCHEMHKVAWERGHQPHNCPSRVIPPTEGRDTAENDAPAIPSDADLDALVELINDARVGTCLNHPGCRDVARKYQRDAARRWFRGRVIPPEESAS